MGTEGGRGPGAPRWPEVRQFVRPDRGRAPKGLAHSPAAGLGRCLSSGPATANVRRRAGQEGLRGLVQVSAAVVAPPFSREFLDQGLSLGPAAADKNPGRWWRGYRRFETSCDLSRYEDAGSGAVNMQPPRRCTTQCCRFPVRDPRNPPPPPPDLGRPSGSLPEGRRGILVQEPRPWYLRSEVPGASFRIRRI